MRVLGVDLTGVTGSMAIVEDGATIAEESITSTDGFGHVMFARLEALLQRAGLRLGEIDCFASASGPGSFTGVRVGLAAVKGLAEAAGVPAIGVSNLRAVASFGETALRMPVLDARRGHVYAALFRADLTMVREETVGSLNELMETWREDGSLSELAVITPDLHLTAGLADVAVLECPNALAPAVARCALLDLQNGAAGDAALLDANYVRRSDAEMFWSDR